MAAMENPHNQWGEGSLGRLGIRSIELGKKERIFKTLHRGRYAGDIKGKKRRRQVQHGGKN